MEVYPSFDAIRRFRMIVGATEAINYAVACARDDGRYEYVRVLAKIVDALPVEVFGGERPYVQLEPNPFLGSTCPLKDVRDE